jgi:hypothetical protein
MASLRPNDQSTKKACTRQYDRKEPQLTAPEHFLLIFKFFIYIYRFFFLIQPFFCV